jgi:hypothetical protein
MALEPELHSPGSSVSSSDFFHPFTIIPGVESITVLRPSGEVLFSDSSPFCESEAILEATGGASVKELVEVIKTGLLNSSTTGPQALSISAHHLTTSTPTSLAFVGQSRASILAFHCVRADVYLVATTAYPTLPNVVFLAVELAIGGMGLS